MKFEPFLSHCRPTAADQLQGINKQTDILKTNMFNTRKFWKLVFVFPIFCSLGAWIGYFCPENRIPRQTLYIFHRVPRYVRETTGHADLVFKTSLWPLAPVNKALLLAKLRLSQKHDMYGFL